MKKLFTFILFIAIGFTVKGQLMYEPFNYTPHATNGLWTQSSALWLRINTGDSVLVTSGSLTYPGLATSAGNKIAFDGSGSDNYRVHTASPVTTGSVYYSFVLNLSALGGLTATGGYFTGMIQAGSTTSYGATVWTRLSATAGRYNVGISTRSNSTVTWLSADLIPGTPCFIVASYDIVSGTANDVARIWLNTTAIGGAEPAADATSATGTDLTTAGIDKVLIRQDGASATPFIEVDEIRVGTSWVDVTPASGPTPTLSASALTGFGNVCINTTAGPNTFTISGTDLTSANVTVAALPGYEYATASGGPYTSSLSLTQSGGSYSQQIFVRFNPTAIQSYNGNIVVAGGGATSINVAATGSGVDDMPTVTTGIASSINPTDATVAGTLPSIGCSPIIQYGFEYSTTSGWTLGTGTQAPASNLSGINFSRVLSLLTPATTYYYRAFAANNAGTAYGAEMSFTTASLSPQLTATALSGFGNVCINSTAGPNSFTINGTNLTSANVDVAALAGYTYSTTSGGTYTSTLSLTQSGGTFSQQIFVRFSPTAVQSYNGNIVVSGGGASSINVAATGAGVNSAPTVTTGSASAITQNTATAAGSIPSIGCSAVTAYGIEYSTTNGFANGSGTQVPSTNLSGGNFTSALTGLAPSTTYYYKAYATNAGGTSWGAQQSFTTAAPTLSASALAAFGNICLNTPSAPASFTITGVGLTNANVSVGPLAGYSFSTTANGTYTASLTLTQPGGAYSQQVFVRLTPTAVQSYNGNIPVSGGGAAAINVAASGAGVNTIPTVTTLPASSITTQTAVLNGNINSNGCSNIIAYGIEYSSINGFADGNGTQLPSNNLQGTAFSSMVTGLVQGATYYYKAYATNSGGTAYGTQQSFTAGSIASGFNFFPNPASPGSSVRITMDNLNPGYHGIKFFNSDGKLVYQKDYYIQGTFINQMLTIPGHLPGGIYQIQVVNFEKILSTKSVLIL